jgi:uncharacterized protein
MLAMPFAARPKAMSLNGFTAATKEMFNKNLQLIETSRLTKLGTMKPDSLILQLPASYWIDLNNYDQVATAKKDGKK